MLNRIVEIAVLVCVLGAARAQGGTPLTTLRVASDLANPIYVTHAPGDYERLFIIEQRGQIRILKDGVVLATPFLNIATQLSLGSEQGLLGLAFHPGYAANRTFYINYTNVNGDTVVAKYTASESDPDRANDDEDTILFVDQPFVNHNGGWIEFGPDGYLYIALGDGGSHGDPAGRGQSIVGELLGNLLRIDINGDDFPGDPLRDYRIPPDNPFVGVTGEDEIWAYGLRNPWRNAFDRKTGDLWIADVGESDWEEINFQPAASRGGENYGWDCREGTQCTAFSECECGSFQSVLPIHTYAHDSPDGTRCSITGGVVYRGCEIPDLAGTYFFADYCNGQIWSLSYDGFIVSVVDRTAELDPPGTQAILSPASFGTDAAGEIYICDRAGTTGEVYKIIPATGAPGLLSTEPTSGTVDARTPLAADGITKLGPREITFYFDKPTNCISPDAFVIEQDGVAGDPPAVSSVLPVADNGLLVTLSRPVEPKAWTTITHGPTLASTRIGYLPGDVNGDGYSGPVDILDLIDSLNGVGGSLLLSSADLDRSGLAAPADIIMLIDLLNGAGNLDPYLGAQLP